LLDLISKRAYVNGKLVGFHPIIIGSNPVARIY
jgi:hypothetical protein